MDIFEELHSEHEEVSRLIAKLEKSGRDEETFETLRTELTAGIEKDAGVVAATDVEGFITAAKTRQWEREPKVRILA